MIQTETFYCQVCDKRATISVDDPVHYTNWNLSGRRTVPVCSEECKQIVIDQEALDRRKAQAKVRRINKRNKETLVKVLSLFAFSDDPIPMYRVPDGQSDIDRILYTICNLVEDDD